MLAVLRPTWDLDSVAAVILLFLEPLGHIERQPEREKWGNLRNILSFEVEKKKKQQK